MTRHRKGRCSAGCGADADWVISYRSQGTIERHRLYACSDHFDGMKSAALKLTHQGQIEWRKL